MGNKFILCNFTRDTSYYQVMSKKLFIDLAFIVLAGLTLMILIQSFGAEALGKFSFIPVLIAYFAGKYFGGRTKR